MTQKQIWGSLQAKIINCISLIYFQIHYFIYLLIYSRPVRGRLLRQLSPSGTWTVPPSSSQHHCHQTHHSRTRFAADTTHTSQHKRHTPHTQTSHFAVSSHATTRPQRPGSCVPHFNPPSSLSLVGMSRFCDLKVAAAAAAAGNEEEPSRRRSGEKLNWNVILYSGRQACACVRARAHVAE